MLRSTFLSGQSVSSRSHVCSARALEAKAFELAKNLQVPTQRIRRSPPLTVENRVTIRFQRLGKKKTPFYRIVAIDSKRRRDGIPIERLGWYNPLSKETSLDAPAIKKWMSLGAKPSEATARILRRAMVIDPDVSKTDLA